MKKIVLGALMAFAGVAANAEITVTLPAEINSGQYVEASVSIADYEKILLRQARYQNVAQMAQGDFKSNIIVVDNKDVPSYYEISIAPFGDESKMFSVMAFASPDDNVNIDVKSVSPMHVEYSGTALMDGINVINHEVMPLEEELIAASNAGNGPECDRIQAEIEKVYTNYITLHPGSPAAPYAMMEISTPKLAIEGFGLLGTELQKTSIIYPLAAAQLQRQQAAYEEELAVEAMKGKPAPEFSLPNLNGKMVSLKDFRGKWVIIDFWGSWCKWCIKGFPELKEAYKAYNGKVEVIGIDCRDSEEQWRNAVKKFELPWVQVFNGENKEVTDAYLVRGYPTKVIIDPKGNLVDVVVGEDPSFYPLLEKLVNGTK